MRDNKNVSLNYQCYHVEGKSLQGYITQILAEEYESVCEVIPFHPTCCVEYRITPNIENSQMWRE